MPAPLRVAVVSPHPIDPAVSGDKIRSQQLLAHLADVGVDGVLATYAWDIGRQILGEGGSVVRVGGRPAQGLSLLLWRASLRRARRGNPYAIFELDGARDRMRCALDAAALDVEDYQHSFVWQPGTRPSVCTFHNVESDANKQQREGGSRQLASLQRAERRAARGCDVAVVFSREDQKRLLSLAPDAVVRVVPLGYQPARTIKHEIREVLSTVAFVGSFSYAPNVEAAKELIRLAPRIRALGVERIKVIGSGAAQHFSSNDIVEIHSDVPDVGEALADADALVVPLRHGGGVRVKVIEALGMGMPIISTAVGSEGLEIRDGVHGLVVTDVDELPAAIGRARPRAVRASLSEQGLALWESAYSPARMAESMKAVYLEAMTLADFRRAGS